MEASRTEVSSRANDLAMRLVQARSYIHSTLSLEYRSIDEPNKPQLAFHHLQAKVVEKEKALRVVEISTLHVLLDRERQSYTSSPSLERELVCLRHLYSRLHKIARDLGFNATGLLCTHSSDDPILLIGFGVLCRAVSNRLDHV